MMAGEGMSSLAFDVIGSCVLLSVGLENVAVILQVLSINASKSMHGVGTGIR